MTSESDCLPQTYPRVSQRLIGEMIVGCIGCALLVAAAAADQQWLDRHFLSDFFIPRAYCMAAGPEMNPPKMHDTREFAPRRFAPWYWYSASPAANAPAAVQFWPGDKAWSWTFTPPPPGKNGDGIALSIREKSTPASPTSIPNIGMVSSAMTRAQADREFSLGKFGGLTGQPAISGSGTATIQLLDLSEAGVASSKPGQNLRVLAKMALAGAEIKLPGDEIYLPPGRFAGHFVVRNPQAWVHGELYLMTFYVQGDSRRYRYDVFLERTGD